jgi:hypothetical protein
LYCIVFYCIVLYCIVLYCIVLYCLCYHNADWLLQRPLSPQATRSFISGSGRRSSGRPRRRERPERRERGGGGAGQEKEEEGAATARLAQHGMERRRRTGELSWLEEITTAGTAA